MTDTEDEISIKILA